MQIIQKLITNQLIDQKGAVYITDTLWTLMESGIEEVKILQSVTLLLTTNTVVRSETLARVNIKFIKIFLLLKYQAPLLLVTFFNIAHFLFQQFFFWTFLTAFFFYFFTAFF